MEEEKTQEVTFMIGDITKGGRPMTEEERKNYVPLNLGEIPKGLKACPDCGEYRGYCVDPSPANNNLIVFVICPCQHAFCSRCGEKLKKQPISNYYNKKDGNIWHVAWFAGVCHKCGQLGTNNMAGEHCHACGKYQCREKCGCSFGEKLHRHIEIEDCVLTCKQLDKELRKQGEELQDYQKFFKEISPLLDKMQERPDLVGVILGEKIDTKMVQSIIQGKFRIVEDTTST